MFQVGCKDTTAPGSTEHRGGTREGGAQEGHEERRGHKGRHGGGARERSTEEGHREVGTKGEIWVCGDGLKSTLKCRTFCRAKTALIRWSNSVFGRSPFVSLCLGFSGPLFVSLCFFWEVQGGREQTTQRFTRVLYSRFTSLIIGRSIRYTPTENTL